VSIFWSLLTLAGVHLLAVASPGPAFVSIIQTSTCNSRRVTLLHVLGLGIGVLVWAIAAVFGMGALLARVAWLYRALELGGGLYLLYIGVQSYRYARVPMAIRATNALEVHLSSLQAFRHGFSTNFANPKVMVFFASIFSAILKPGTPLWVRLAAITIVFFNETVWDGGLALLLSTPHAQHVYTRSKSAIDRTAGAVMSLFGIRLIWGAIRATR
jgi:threonine efflux protein